MSLEQQRVAFTSWSVFGSALVLGTSLVRMSPGTAALVTNKEVIAIARDAVTSRQLSRKGVPCGGGKHSGMPCAATYTYGWEVTMPSNRAYYALFNLGPIEQTLDVATGLRGKVVYDVWLQQPAGATATNGSIVKRVPPNSTELLRVYQAGVANTSHMVRAMHIQHTCYCASCSLADQLT